MNIYINRLRHISPEQDMVLIAATGSRVRSRARPSAVITMDLVAVPAKGTAPLEVTFIINVRGLPPYQGLIKFGDGSEERIPRTFFRQITIRHTYTAAGTYTVQVSMSGLIPGVIRTATATVTVETSAKPQLSVALTASTTTPAVGQDVRLSAVWTPTAAPYTVTWKDETADKVLATQNVNVTNATYTVRFSTSGTATISVTVTDNNGVSGSARVTLNITVPIPQPSTILASDTFNTPSTDGWPGWRHDGIMNFSIRDFTVNNDTAQIRIPAPLSGTTANAIRDAFKPDFVQQSVFVQFDFSLPALPKNKKVFIGAVARYINRDNTYFIRAEIAPDGTVTLAAARRVNGTTSTIKSVLLAFKASPNAWYRLLAGVVYTDPTYLVVKLWPVSATAPNDYQLIVSDSTSELQYKSDMKYGAGIRLSTPGDYPVSDYPISALYDNATVYTT